MLGFVAELNGDRTADFSDSGRTRELTAEEHTGFPVKVRIACCYTSSIRSRSSAKRIFSSFRSSGTHMLNHSIGVLAARHSHTTFPVKQDKDRMCDLNPSPDSLMPVYDNKQFYHGFK